MRYNKKSAKQLTAIILAVITIFILMLPASATMAPGIAGGGNMGRASDDTAQSSESSAANDAADGNGNVAGGTTQAESSTGVGDGMNNDVSDGIVSDQNSGGELGDGLVSDTTAGTANDTSAANNGANDASTADGADGNTVAGEAGSGKVWGIIIAIIIIAAIALLIFAFIPKKK